MCAGGGTTERPRCHSYPVGDYSNTALEMCTVTFNSRVVNMRTVADGHLGNRAFAHAQGEEMWWCGSIELSLVCIHIVGATPRHWSIEDQETVGMFPTNVHIMHSPMWY